MTMTLPRPSALGQRPAYLDSLFRHVPPHTSGAHSSTSSISTNSTASTYDLRSAFHASTPLSPALDECASDTQSIRSKKSFLLTPKKFRLGTILHRRTYPQVDQRGDQVERPSTAISVQTFPPPPPPPPSPPSPPTHSSQPRASPVQQVQTRELRRPSLPKIQTSFPPPRAVSTYAKRPLPAVPAQAPPAATAAPQPKPQPTRKVERQPSTGELSCQRCYYFAARNCNGYVLGGEAGDACEMCLPVSLVRSNLTKLIDVMARRWWSDPWRHELCMSRRRDLMTIAIWVAQLSILARDVRLMTSVEMRRPFRRGRTDDADQVAIISVRCAVDEHCSDSLVCRRTGKLSESISCTKSNNLVQSHAMENSIRTRIPFLASRSSPTKLKAARSSLRGYVHMLNVTM
ncbi:hypothetical protein AC579_10510 [Pseudocercospora musae]|uniref:Uncharacterized protein n=1 Tax=Pseudocercospora musae TaxID=113226 RepID=A0A139I4Z8_9PEZI|nr:hypothetical protein AC579_10510 [Pseudocercospora musae]